MELPGATRYWTVIFRSFLSPIDDEHLFLVRTFTDQDVEHLEIVVGDRLRSLAEQRRDFARSLESAFQKVAPSPGQRRIKLDVA